MSFEINDVDEIGWQKKWAEAGIFHSEIHSDKPPFYCLEMYPYPSGYMHMGHVRNYSIGDAVARYKRMMGFDVLYPMGFDSFGMPAENAAITEGGHPYDITERNMASITGQIKRMGFSYDWRRQVKSHDPNYYKWNQWFFLQFLKQGIAKREFSNVNWCEACTTVLANEQVKAGRCWRCNGPVSQKAMEQWFLDIPSYCQELLDGLETINFPENVKSLQKDWLGRSEGVEITFEIEGFDTSLTVFTTRPDTLFGVTFVTLAPDHPLAHDLVKGTPYEDDWRALYSEVERLSEFDRILQANAKKGVPTGRFALHPLTGEAIPIWVGNFVISTYGTGAVMAVPGHDERDFDFAQAYGIPIRRVLIMDESTPADEPLTHAETELGWMVNSSIHGFDGLFGEAAKDAVATELESCGKGKRVVNWKIRPWLISRQRYWGTPIPIIHCDGCGVVPVPEDQLPVELPTDIVFDTGNPLDTSESFVNTPCPLCQQPARRETDTMDTFIDSSWYYFRYTDALNHDRPFDTSIAEHWMNVDFYCGGIEHAQMHLIYARFMTKALRDIGLHSIDEPFNELLCQGMVNKSAPFCQSCNITLSIDHEGAPCPHCESDLSSRSAKMSKSLGNTVSPEKMIEQFGADTVRLFILFAANPTAGMDWSDTALEANHRVMLQMRTIPSQLMAWDGAEHEQMDAWLKARFHQRLIEFVSAMDVYDLRRAVEISHYELIKDINWYTRRGGNNSLLAQEILPQWAQLLSVSTPHLAEEWWARLGQDGFVAQSIATFPSALTSTEHVSLYAEHLTREVLDQARKVYQIASRHLETIRSATIVCSPKWKWEMANAAITHLKAGENIKSFSGILANMPMMNSPRKGEFLGYWNKKMLSQVFKWDDESRFMIQSNMNEVSILKGASQFLQNELQLQDITVVLGESEQDTTERSQASLPLSPAIVYE